MFASYRLRKMRNELRLKILTQNSRKTDYQAIKSDWEAVVKWVIKHDKNNPQ